MSHLSRGRANPSQRNPTATCSGSLLRWVEILLPKALDPSLSISWRSPRRVTTCSHRKKQKSRCGETRESVWPRRLTLQRAPRKSRVALRLVIRRLYMDYTARNEECNILDRHPHGGLRSIPAARPSDICGKDEAGCRLLTVAGLDAGPRVRWRARQARSASKKARPRRSSVEGGKRFMPLGMSDPHDLGQAGDVRSQIVWLRLKKHGCQSQQN
jgi:hypothetical protein